MTSRAPNKTRKYLEPSHYVAIGASAGGLEALQKFMQHLPEKTGCAFIIIQHLSPDFKSMMDELLARQTKIPIFQAVHEERLSANCIYLAPPRHNLIIENGFAHLQEQENNGGHFFPIDNCFNALANDQQERAIAIILSGTGSDGSRGIQTIKELGGLVLVQDPSDAKFDGMPCSAIQTGHTDACLLVEDIPLKIVKYISHPSVSGEQSTLVENTEGTEAALKEIFDLLLEKNDIDFTCYKGSTINRRIDRRMSIKSLANVQEYLSLLQTDVRELDILSKDMLIGVTSFFRDADAFEMLESTIIPEIFDSTPVNEPIRIWVAACSTAEETYSLAMLFDEAMQSRKQARIIKIFATDVNADSIAKASFGQYTLNIANDVSEERLSRYFTRQDDTFTIIPAIRQMVVFASHNLLKDPPFSNCQLAVCRNALIYFQQNAQKRILSMLHFSLTKDGYMFLGSSESLGELQNHFETVDDHNKLYKKVSNEILMVEQLPSAVKPKEAKKVPSVGQLLGTYQNNQKPPQYLPVYEKLIEDYVPACIVLNNELNVLHIFGDVDIYTSKLRSGKFSSNIKEFIAESLKVAVSAALYRAQTLKQNVYYKNISFEDAEQNNVLVDLSVVFVNTPSMLAPHLAILFKKEVVDKVLAKKNDTEDYNSQKYNQQLIHDLEEALRKKQEHLQATVEELQTTNEELQSSNEELMAANEELQSTNEELQSVNEELYSVNSEYQEKITEITQANQDIVNILDSADISFIFLDDAMLIRRFSSNAASSINLMPSDIGRPIHHISHSLIYDTFLNDIARSIQNTETTETEISTTNSQQMLIKISPYYNEQKLAMGCVISLTDMTELRKLKQKLVDSWQELRSTLDTSLLQKKQSLKVLVVDDDTVDKKAILRAINNIRSPSSVYLITEADNFETAQTMLASNEFDICILDHNLGAHTGCELVRNLKTKSTSTAFILLSGVITENMAKDAIELGIFDVIDKQDVSPALLEQSIKYTHRHKQTEIFLGTQ